jgi:hypothetical protein
VKEAWDTLGKCTKMWTDEFKNIKCVIEESNNLSTLTIDELEGSLMAHEQRRKMKQETLEEALQVKTSLNNKKFNKGTNSKTTQTRISEKGYFER